MKPSVLRLHGTEIELSEVQWREGVVSQVGYFDDTGQYHILFDSKHTLPNYSSVEDLDSKVFSGDGLKVKSEIIQEIENFLNDEHKLLDLENNEVAEAMVDCVLDKSKTKRVMQCVMHRQEQIGKVDGIIDALDLVKLI